MFRPVKNTQPIGHQSYYEILGVPQDANIECIKKAFRRKALQFFHGKGIEPNYQEDVRRFVQEFLIWLQLTINKAYAVLSDPEKREFYDKYGFYEFAEAQVFDEVEIDGKKPFAKSLMNLRYIIVIQPVLWSQQQQYECYSKFERRHFRTNRQRRLKDKMV